MTFKTGDDKPGKSGRKKGVPNIATRDLKEALRKHTPEMIKELVRLAKKAEHEATRVAAIKEIFDRCYGRSVQPIQGDLTYGVSEQLAEMLKASSSEGTLGSEIARRAANGQQHH
jgi:hypothetical protein